jgi:hypothetical protein
MRVANLVPQRFDVAGCNIQVLTDLDGGAFWWTQAQMAEAFGLDVKTISEHLTDQKNGLFATEFAESGSVIRDFPVTASDGK